MSLLSSARVDSECVESGEDEDKRLRCGGQALLILPVPGHSSASLTYHFFPRRAKSEVGRGWNHSLSPRSGSPGTGCRHAGEIGSGSADALPR